MRTIVNVGDTFNRLKVLGRKGHHKDGKPLWECLCTCGKITLAKTVELTSNKKKSCGCLKSENKSNFSHGDGSVNKGKAAEYVAWQAIIQRCYNKNAPGYKNYGGRGISMEERWRNSYAEFLKDVGRKPSPKHSLDRIDVNGNYVPNNCRWATSVDQQSNKRDNHWIEHDGETHTLKQWADILETTSSSILTQIKRGKPFSEIHQHYSILKGKEKSATDIIYEITNAARPLARYFKRYGDAIQILSSNITQSGYLIVIDFNKIEQRIKQ